MVLGLVIGLLLPPDGGGDIPTEMDISTYRLNQHMSRFSDNRGNFTLKILPLVNLPGCLYSGDQFDQLSFGLASAEKI